MEKDIRASILMPMPSTRTLETDEDEFENQSTVSFLFQQLKEFYVENIPVEIVKRLPSGGKFLVGAFCYLAAFVIFVYFAYSNYNTSMNQAFISLDSSSGDCTTVPISITTSYFSDINGHWEGTPAFLYYQSSYRFQFSSFSVGSVEAYQEMMAIYYDTLQYYGRIAENQNLALNLVLWMSFVRFYSTANPYTTDFSTTGRGNLQYIQMAGDPSIVFSARYNGLSLGSSTGFCRIPAMVIYDQANALYRATIPMESFLNSSSCSAVTTPFIFLSQQSVFNSYFSIQLDVRSFSTALAVNLGYIQIQNLMLASGSILKINIKQNIYAVGQYFDVRYPEMAPIFCLYNITELPKTAPQLRNLCLIATGSGFFLPVFNHMGNSLVHPQYCDCSNPAIGRSSQCNKFYLMASLISFPVPSDSSSTFAGPQMMTALLKAAFELVAKHGSNYQNLNRASFNASVISTLTAMGAMQPDPAMLSKAYSFCRLPSSGEVCSLITFYSLDQDNTVSQFHFPLLDGSCADSITMNATAWASLSADPPTPLTQIYYQCYPLSSDAFLNSVGVASGNTSIAMLLLLFICVPIVFTVMALCRPIPIPLEYTENQKNTTLDTLATLILRVRDEHYEGIDEKSTVAKVAEELIDAVKESERALMIHHTKSFYGTDASRSPDFKKSIQDIKAAFEEESHRDLLGRVNIYRHKHDDHHSDHHDYDHQDDVHYGGVYSLTKTAFRQNAETTSYVMKVFSDEQYDSLETGNEMSSVRKGNMSKKSDLKLETKERILRLRIMNEFEKDVVFPVDDSSWLLPYSNCKIDVLIEGLLFYFSAAVRNEIIREKNNNTKANEGTPLYQIDFDYTKGCILSRKLLEMDVEELLSKQDSLLYSSLANALSMHAHLATGFEMKYISNEIGDRIGYQIGDKVFTYSTIIAYSLVSE